MITLHYVPLARDQFLHVIVRDGNERTVAAIFEEVAHPDNELTGELKALFTRQAGKADTGNMVVCHVAEDDEEFGSANPTIPIIKRMLSFQFLDGGPIQAPGSQSAPTWLQQAFDAWEKSRS